MRWNAGHAPTLHLEALVCSSGVGTEREPLACLDGEGRDVAITAEVLDTRWASIAWLSFKPRRRVSLRRAA